MQVWCLLASQPARVLHITDSRQVFLLKSFCRIFFPPLGSTVAVIKSTFCALPEQVSIKAAASHSSTCPDLYYPSEVFAKRKILGNEHLLSLRSCLGCASATGLAEIRDVCTILMCYRIDGHYKTLLETSLGKHWWHR